MENVTENSTETVVTENSAEGTALTPEAITAALAATRANKSTATPAASSTEKAKRPKLSDEEKAAKEAKRKEDQAARKAERDRVAAEKKAQRDAERAAKVPHMSKVDKAAANLPAISAELTTEIESLFSDHSASDITAMVAHLQHRLRANATANALNVHLTEGQMVRINSGDANAARYVGRLAKVVVVQRIRCYVTPVGEPDTKRVYLFNSDVSPVTDEEINTVESSDGEGESLAAVG